MNTELPFRTTRREFLAATAAPAVLTERARAGARRPNFIFIYTDDQRWDAVRALGRQTWLRTPNLDRLMKHGGCSATPSSPPRCARPAAPPC